MAEDSPSKASLDLTREEAVAGFLDTLNSRDRMDYEVMHYLIVKCGGCTPALPAFLWGTKINTPTKLTRTFNLDKAQEWLKEGLPEEITRVELEQLNAVVQALLMWKFSGSGATRNRAEGVA